MAAGFSAFSGLGRWVSGVGGQAPGNDAGETAQNHQKRCSGESDQSFDEMHFLTSCSQAGSHRHQRFNSVVPNPPSLAGSVVAVLLLLLQASRASARTAPKYTSLVSLTSPSSTASRSRQREFRRWVIGARTLCEAENLLRVAQGTGEKTSCVRLGCKASCVRVAPLRHGCSGLDNQ